MDGRILFLKKWMLENLRHPATVQEMSRLVEMSASNLQHLFKREAGVSPLQYLQHLRLEAARRLLESSFKSIKEIRFQVGIRDKSHFVRDFKAKYGVTPSEYRRRYWAKLEIEQVSATEL